MIYNKKLIPLVLACILVFAAGYLKNSDEKPVQSGQTLSGEMLAVRYIDVGQGDCELITFPDGRNMLIDAGTTDSEKALPDYLRSIGVEKLDYVIGTHPHEDHIGGMDTVINSFDIGEIYMPKATTTTKTYKDVLTAVKNKGLTINTAKAGKIIIDEYDIKAELLAPVNDNYEGLNNYSAVLKLQFKDTSFLFTGDAEKLSEDEMLKAAGKTKLKCDVLKVGHHGSSTSTTEKFLNAVSPSFAVISCETGNSYGHPHKETIDILEKYKVKTYRTDLNGTVTAVSDGKNITFNTER